MDRSEWVVATQNVNTRRATVRSIAWLGRWMCLRNTVVNEVLLRNDVCNHLGARNRDNSLCVWSPLKRRREDPPSNVPAPVADVWPRGLVSLHSPSTVGIK